MKCAMATILSVLVILGGATTEVNRIHPDEQVALDDIFERSVELNQFTTLCGPLSLARVMQIHGREVKFPQFLSEFTERSSEGVRVSEIITVGENEGFFVVGVSFDSKRLSDVPLPSILIVDHSRHCLVLEKYNTENQVAEIWDPSSLRTIRIPARILEMKWDGGAILVKRSKWYEKLLSSYGVTFFLSIIIVNLIVFGNRRSKSK